MAWGFVFLASAVGSLGFDCCHYSNIKLTIRNN